MAKTILLTVLFWVGIISLPGCNDCKCPDVNTVRKYVDIEGVGSYIRKKASATSGLGTVKADDKIRWDELAYFSVGYTIRLYGVHINQRKSPTNWGMAAYACSCIEPGYLGSQERLKRITVKTAFDFDANYAAGSTVDELVAVVIIRDHPKPLKDYLSEGPLSYNEYSRLDLIFNKAPSVKGPFALDITIELDNGEVYTTRTPVIQLI